MEKYINQIINGDCLAVMKELPDKCIDLVLTDPPYFEIKGEFDFQYKSFDEYLKLIEDCAKEFKRILKDNGSILMFGHAKRIAYIQVMFDKYFNLENNLVWHVYDRQTNKGIENFRCFAPVTERILFYSNEIVTVNGLCVNNCREYIRLEIIRAKGKIVYKEVNQALGVADTGGGIASAVLSLDKSEPSMITEEHYLKLRQWLNERKGYEYLRKEYEELRRPFNNIMKLTDVIKWSQESHITGKYKHDTIKPLGLIQVLIDTCSRPNDLVLDPFLGSGTTAVACKATNRRFIGIEINEKYCEIARKRVENQASPML